MAGETFIEMKWYPDPMVVANEFRAMADHIEDMTEPLEASAEPIAGAMQRTIEEQGHGQWPPWAESYAPTAAVTNIGGMLWRFGELYSSLDNIDNFLVVDNMLFFEGEAMPQYGWWNQEGAERSRGGNLPARPFIGMDEIAEAEIIGIFEAWLFGEGFSISAKGQIRTPSGRFGPKLH